MSFIIPIFIPHEGCRFRCIFCNQHSISGQADPPVTAAEVQELIVLWLQRAKTTSRDFVQVAFYGGSFTGLPISRQEMLLGAVQPFIDQGVVHAIRLSTRPDYIDVQRLDLLRKYRVSIVELGVQSCSDHVLKLANRGHSCEDVATAAHLIKQSGLGLGMQLLLGLPGDTFCLFRQTVAAVQAIHPDFVRLYPVLVLKGSGLAFMYREKGYRPLSLGKAIVFTAWAKKRLAGNGISVIRMGLQPARELEEALIAGPYHPAFGELVNARLMLHQVRQALRSVKHPEKVQLVIAAQDQSLFRGHKGANIRRLQQLGLNGRFTLALDPRQPRSTLRVLPYSS